MTTQWRKLEGPSPRRIDPYLAWARSRDGERFQSLLKLKSIPLLFELNIPAADFALGRLAGRNPLPDDRRSWLEVPNLYAQPPPGFQATTFCTGLVSDQFFDELKRNDALRDTVKRFQ